LFDGVFLSNVEGNCEYHRRSFIFWKEVSDSLNKLEVEVFYSALVFFDFGGSGGLFDDRSKPTFGDDEGLVG
jgi:hypothetical protein